MYGDVTNLYGWCLSQRLPIGEFSWEEFSLSNLLDLIQNYNHDTYDYGYIVEVDLSIPEELHSFFEDYPPIPEKLLVKREMLSPWSLLLQGESSYTPTVKLSPNLFDKQRYICHILNLQTYLDLGIILEKVHRVLRFQQSTWLKEYIDFNILQRINAMSDAERDFFKLMINGNFGKSFFLIFTFFLLHYLFSSYKLLLYL